MTNKSQPIYIRLDKETGAIVENHLNKTKLDRSSAIRLIIREWKEMKEERENLISRQYQEYLVGVSDPRD